MDEEAWEWFTHRWNTYKNQANLPVTTKSHLESCLGDNVTHILFGKISQTGWDKLTEELLLENVKNMFVKKRNRIVNRKKLHRLMQKPDQPVQQYNAKLKLTARTCCFSITCTRAHCNTSIDYSNKMVLDQLIHGLNDDNIQRKVLSSQEEDSNLEEVEKIIVVQECSQATQKESRLNLLSEQITPTTPKRKQDHIKKCLSCGSEEHGSYTKFSLENKNECKANGKFCERCGKPNHLTSACRSKLQKGKDSTGDNESTLGSVATDKVDKQHRDAKSRRKSNQNHLTTVCHSRIENKENIEVILSPVVMGKINK